MKSVSTPGRHSLILLLTLVALCYMHGYYEDYVFDDASLIAKNDAIRSLDYLPGLVGLGKTPVPTHRVVRTISYLLDHLIWGDNLRGFHYTNLFIHLLNTLLVFALARRVLGAGPWAFVAALLWGIHPVHTDAVTYLSGRRDVLSALFYLWALDRYLAWRTGETGRGSLVVSLALYVTGCFAKEHVVTLPAVIVLYEVMAARRADRDRQHPLTTLARQAVAQFCQAPVYYGLIAVFPVAFTAYIVHFHPFNIGQHYITERLPGDVLSLATYGLHYLVLMVFPRDLSVDYFPLSLPGSAGLTDPNTLLALGVLGALAVLTLVAMERGSHAGFGAGFWVIAFLPMSNLFIRSNEPIAEHYLYLPAVGMALALAAGMRALARRKPSRQDGLLTLVAVAAVVLIWRTDQRNREWEDPEQLFIASLEVFPGSSRMWNNLACIYMARGDFPTALAKVDKAIALSPREALYHYNRAFIRRKQGLWDLALGEYDAALKERPEYADAQIGRAFDLIQLKRYDDALAQYRAILSDRQDDPRRWYYHHWSGVAYREKGDFAHAREEFAVALKEGNRHPETLWQLAMSVTAEARKAKAAAPLYTEAEELLKEALREAPLSAVLHGVLGDLYREMGKPDQALAEYSEMGKANDEYIADAALRRARLLADLKRLDEARAAYQTARSYDFKDPELEARLR